MMNATEMTRAEVLAEIQRLAEIAMQMTAEKDPEKELEKVEQEIDNIPQRTYKAGEVGSYYEELDNCRYAESTEVKKEAVLNLLASIGFKQTGNGIYSLKVGSFKDKYDYSMKLNLTVCGETNARIRLNGDYENIPCCTVEDASKLYKLTKKRITLEKEILRGNAVDNKLRECIDRIADSAE